ncbi:MAG: hypothetical protein ABI743_01685 [bacterium]
MTDLELPLPVCPPDTATPRPSVRPMPLAITIQIAFSAIYIPLCLWLNAGSVLALILAIASILPSSETFYHAPNDPVMVALGVCWLGVVILHGQMVMDLAARHPRGWYLALISHEIWLSFIAAVLLGLGCVAISPIPLTAFLTDEFSIAMFLAFLGLGAISWFWRRQYFRAECCAWCFIGSEAASRRWSRGGIYTALWTTFFLGLMLVRVLQTGGLDG